MLSCIFRFKSHFEPHSNREWMIKAVQEFTVWYDELWWASPERSWIQKLKSYGTSNGYLITSHDTIFSCLDNPELPISGSGMLTWVINVSMFMNSECKSDYNWPQTLHQLQEQAKPVKPRYIIVWKKNLSPPQLICDLDTNIVLV